MEKMPQRSIRHTHVKHDFQLREQIDIQVGEPLIALLRDGTDVGKGHAARAVSNPAASNPGNKVKLTNLGAMALLQ
ncbi:hypothetical protein ON010_g10720 [Phytophthora cinnamomi]|nr:hypothetical protein ON010_g10720 [Phytophthora cinnamomi]